MYSPLQLYHEITGNGNMNDWLTEMGTMLALGGWTVEIVGTSGTLTSQALDVFPWSVFGGSSDTDGFWIVKDLSTGKTAIIVDDQKSVATDDTTGRLGYTIADPPTVGSKDNYPKNGDYVVDTLTGQTPPDTHRAILIAILLLLGQDVEQIQGDNSFVSSTVEFQPIDSTHTRVILKTQIANTAVSITIGASLRSSFSSWLNGGIKAKSQAPIYSGNYIRIFLSVYTQGTSVPFLHIVAAKEWQGFRLENSVYVASDYPPDCPTGTGLVPVEPVTLHGIPSYYTSQTTFGQGSLINIETLGRITNVFVNPYQLVFNSTSGTSKIFVLVGAMKPMFTSECTVFIHDNNGGLTTHTYTANPTASRFALDGKAYYGAGADRAYLSAYCPGRSDATNIGVPWHNGAYEAWEPWIAFNLSGGSTAPAVGQMWDTHGYWGASGGTGEIFAWDGYVWRKFGVFTQTPIGFSSPSPPATISLVQGMQLGSIAGWAGVLDGSLPLPDFTPQ